MFAVFILQCFVFVVLALDSDNQVGYETFKMNYELLLFLEYSCRLAKKSTSCGSFGNWRGNFTYRTEQQKYRHSEGIGNL